MKINGVTFNVEELAKGILQFMPPDDKACLVFGMVPARWMNLSETLIRKKLVKLQYPLATGDEVDVLAGMIKQDLMRAVMKGLGKALLSEATRQGICKV